MKNTRNFLQGKIVKQKKRFLIMRLIEWGKRMKILILGGTRFLGRAFVEEALNRGHEGTLFNRGTNKEVFPEVEQLIGDRNDDVSSLENRKWDMVIDTCGFSPHH